MVSRTEELLTPISGILPKVKNVDSGENSSENVKKRTRWWWKRLCTAEKIHLAWTANLGLDPTPSSRLQKKKINR
jgi:hypothetical protein